MKVSEAKLSSRRDESQLTYSAVLSDWKRSQVQSEEQGESRVAQSVAFCVEG